MSAPIRVALFLVGVSLPIQGYSFLDFAFGMTPFKLATALLLVLCLVQFVVSGRGLPPDRKRWWMFGFLVSFGIACVSGFVSGNTLSETLIVASTYVSLVLYYFLVVYAVRGRSGLLILLWSLLLGGAITAAPAVLGLERGAELGYGERYTGLAGQANVLGFDMAICLPIGAALFFGARSLALRGLAAGLGLACLLGLLLSLSRSAFVSLAVMGVVWVIRSGRSDSIKYLFPALGLAIGLALLAPDAVVERIETMVDPSRRAADGSIQSRFHQFGIALSALASSPLVGLGVLRFIPWANAQPGGFGQGHEVHNAYLGVAVEQGLVGLVLYAGILLLTLGDYSRCLRLVRTRRWLRDPALAELGHYAAFLQIALIGSLVGGLFGMAQRSKTMWLVLALSPVLIGMARARIRLLEPAESRDPELAPAGFAGAAASQLPSRP